MANGLTAEEQRELEELRALKSAQPVPRPTPVPTIRGLSAAESAELEALRAEKAQQAGFLDRAKEAATQFGQGALETAFATPGFLADVGGQISNLVDKIPNPLTPIREASQSFVFDRMGIDPATVRQSEPARFGEFTEATSSVTPQITREPVTTEERFSRNVGRLFVPGGVRTIPQRLIGAGAGAVGATTAQELAPDSPAVEIAATLGTSAVPSVVGRVAREGRSIVSKASPASQKAAVDAEARQIVESLGGEDLAGRVKSTKQAGTDPRTLAERAESRGLAALESELGGTVKGGEVLEVARTARQGGRQATLKQVAGGGPIDSARAGEAIKGAVEASTNKLKVQSSKLFKRVDPKGTSKIAVLKEKGAVQDFVKDALEEGINDIENAGVKKLVTRFVKGKNIRSFKEIQQMRSKALELSRKIRKAPEGSNTDAAIAERLAKALDGSAERAANTGKGFSPEQVKRWRRARKAFLEAKEIEKGPLRKVLKQDVDEKVLDTLVRGGAKAADEFIKVAGKSDETMTILRRALVDKVRKVGPEKLTAAKMSSFLQQNDGFLKRVLTPDHRRKLGALVKEMKSEGRKLQRAREVKGTVLEGARTQSVFQWMAARFEGKAAFQFPATTNAIKTLLRQADIGSKEELQTRLLEVALEPDLIDDLLRPVTLDRVESFLPKFRETMVRNGVITTALQQGQGSEELGQALAGEQ